MEHSSIRAHTRTSVSVVSGDVAHQGLEERSYVVGLSPEEVLVAARLLAHLFGNDRGEGLKNALLVEVLTLRIL